MDSDLYFFFVKLLGGLSRLLFRIRYVGREHVPKDGKLILCCNHRSVIDPLFLAYPLRRQVFYMAKSELFDDHGRLARWFLYRMGAFPVHRNTGDAESFRNALSVLERGEIMGIFPQGGCVFDKDTEFKPKAGAALIAAKAKAPVLPASIYCEGRVRPFKKITVLYGEAIPYESLGFAEGTVRESREAAKKIAAQVSQLLEERH